MNNSRRKEIESALELLEKAKDILESCAADERESFDNLPDGLQQAERGQAMEAAADALDSMVGYIESAMGEAGTALE